MVALQYYFLLHSKINVMHIYISPLFKILSKTIPSDYCACCEFKAFFFFFLQLVSFFVLDCSGFPLKPQVPQIQWMENHRKSIIFFREKQLLGLGSHKCPATACLFAYSLIQLSVINIYLARHAKHCAKSRNRNNKTNTFLISGSVNHFFFSPSLHVAGKQLGSLSCTRHTFRSEPSRVKSVMAVCKHANPWQR